MLPAGMHEARSWTVCASVNVSAQVPVEPCALFGVTTSRIVIAANPMMSYLSRSPLVLKTDALRHRDGNRRTRAPPS